MHTNCRFYYVLRQHVTIHNVSDWMIDGLLNKVKQKRSGFLSSKPLYSEEQITEVEWGSLGRAQLGRSHGDSSSNYHFQERGERPPEVWRLGYGYALSLFVQKTVPESWEVSLGSPTWCEEENVKQVEKVRFTVNSVMVHWIQATELMGLPWQQYRGRLHK